MVCINRKKSPNSNHFIALKSTFYGFVAIFKSTNWLLPCINICPFDFDTLWTSQIHQIYYHDEFNHHLVSYKLIATYIIHVNHKPEIFKSQSVAFKRSKVIKTGSAISFVKPESHMPTNLTVWGDKVESWA